jgi:hypothetical protein
LCELIKTMAALAFKYYLLARTYFLSAFSD